MSNGLVMPRTCAFSSSLRRFPWSNYKYRCVRRCMHSCTLCRRTHARISFRPGTPACNSQCVLCRSRILDVVATVENLNYMQKRRLPAYPTRWCSRRHCSCWSPRPNPSFVLGLFSTLLSSSIMQLL